MASRKQKKQRAILRNAQRHQEHPERGIVLETMSLEEIIAKKGYLETKISSMVREYQDAKRNLETQQTIARFKELKKQVEAEMEKRLKKIAKDFADQLMKGGPRDNVISGQGVHGWISERLNIIHVNIHVSYQEECKTYEYPLDPSKPIIDGNISWNCVWDGEEYY